MRNNNLIDNYKIIFYIFLNGCHVEAWDGVADNHGSHKGCKYVRLI